jgi:biotin carboxyl carrier protein
MKKFDFIIHGNEYDVEILEVENNIAILEVNGTRYEVELKSETPTSKTPTLVRADLPIQKRETKIPKSIRSERSSKILAPLPGTILNILVEQGGEVKKGDTLLIMEAMKMENKILAEQDGKVEKIYVTSGESVLQDAPLIEIA